MFGFIINRLRHAKETFLSKNDVLTYYLLLTSFNNIDPYICVAVGRTEGELNLNINKKSYSECFKYLEKITSKREIHFLGLRADEILELDDKGIIVFEDHDFNIIF